eukprot:m.153042 g.153042  ORF g.153042 m.153042 type:complete len:80 (-) comp52853_c0_seq6:737-976(-)
MSGGWTALMKAAYWGRTASVEALLAHGADRTIKNKACTRPYARICLQLCPRLRELFVLILLLSFGMVFYPLLIVSCEMY